MGTWDGLKRQNIRIVVDIIDLHINVKGLAAIFVGIVCALGVAAISVIGIQWIVWVVTKCQRGALCILQTTVVAPVTDWIAVICLACAGGLLTLWLPTAFSEKRPYRRFLLAPGIWYREEEVIAHINERLAQAQPSSINEDMLLQIASSVRSRLQLQRFGFRAERISDPSTRMLIDSLVNDIDGHNKSWRKSSADKATLREIVKAIIEYYLRTQAAANRIWPWRKKILGR